MYWSPILLLQDKITSHNAVRWMAKLKMLAPAHLFQLLSHQQEKPTNRHLCRSPNTDKAVQLWHHHLANRQRQDDMYAKCVTKGSLLLHNLRNTSVCILERDHIIVRFVISASHSWVILENICKYTTKTKPISVRCVISASLQQAVSKHTWEYILEKDHISVKCVISISLDLTI